jgi:hypothetical protein
MRVKNMTVERIACRDKSRQWILASMRQLRKKMPRDDSGVRC